MAQIPTVRIVHPTARGGYARINLSDFDPVQHVLFDPLPKQEQIQDVLFDQRPVTTVTTVTTAPIQDDVSRETPVTPAPKKRGRPRKEA